MNIKAISKEVHNLAWEKGWHSELEDEDKHTLISVVSTLAMGENNGR